MFHQHFVKPQGILGKIIGRFMEKENDQLNDWTLSFLDIEDGERVLEVGFGSGGALEKVAQKKTAALYGIDPSEAMVETVLKKLNAPNGPGQVGIFQGEAIDLALFQEPLDKVYAVNNITFWDQPVQTLVHLRSLMNDGGRIALTLRPHENGATDDTTEVLGGQLQSMLVAAGFQHVKIHFKPADPNDAVCVVGRV